MEELIGATLGQYQILEKIGQGGMAHVFKAYQPSLDRLVAIKVLSPIMAQDPNFTERFQREARSIARLHHPNILQVHDFGQVKGLHYIVMHYVKDSLTLGQLIRDKAPLSQQINYLLQVADALNYAHEQGIVHRDVKPSNILIDGKWALLSDFGLVKLSSMSEHLTSTGLSMGTPAYMSPEQASGKPVDHRTDVYALGIILYRVLTGKIPHDAPTPLAIAIKRSTEPIPSPRRLNPELPESLEKVVLCSLAIEPEVRYSTAIGFAKALKKAIDDPGYREPTLNDRGSDHTMIATDSKLPAIKKKRIAGWLIGSLVAGLLVIALIVVAVSFQLYQVFGPGSDDAVAQNNTPTATPPPPATLISPTRPPAPLARAVAKAVTRLAVRSGPGQIYELQGYLPAGAIADIVGRDESGDWWQIRTTLTVAGVGWIQVDEELVEAADATNIPIALAPPTPTLTPTVAPATATPTVAPATATPTRTPTAATTTATATRTPTATSTPRTVAIPNVLLPTPTPTATSAPAGQFSLLAPASTNEPTFGLTEFEWQWSGVLAENQGFEVRVWRDGAAPAGVHNAVLDNREGRIQALGNNTYRLVADIGDTPGVLKQTGEYNWTVLLIQLEPYQELGQAPVGRLRYNAPGPSDGGGNGNGGGGDPGSI